MFAVRDSNLTAMMLMMQVFLIVTQCHLAYGFWSFESSTYIFKCPTIQEDLTLYSSKTFDTKPKALYHITEDLNPHLGSAYRMWWDMIHLPHFLSPSSSCSRNVDAGLLVSDATDLSVVAWSHKEPRSEMPHILSYFSFPHFKYCIPNIIVKFPPLCVSLLSEVWGKNT